MRLFLFNAIYAPMWQVLLAGQWLARRYETARLGDRVLIFGAWLPVRLVGLGLFWLAVVVAPSES